MELLQILGALPRCKSVVCLYKIGNYVFLFAASSLEDWTPLGAPCGDDPVVAALKALAEECVHGRGYCRQVLCLYELSKDRSRFGTLQWRARHSCSLPSCARITPWLG